MTKTVISAGTLFSITTGDHGDYTVLGIFRTLKDLDPSAYREAYLAQNPKQRERYAFENYQFIAALTRDGFLEAVPCTELNIGEYGSGRFFIDSFGRD